MTKLQQDQLESAVPITDMLQVASNVILASTLLGLAVLLAEFINKLKSVSPSLVSSCTCFAVTGQQMQHLVPLST